MRKIRTAIVGCGKVAQFHAAALGALAEADFVAACDTDPARAAAFAARYGVRPFENVISMVEQAAVEATIICTPHPLHATPAVAAAERGSHVLVEKPLAA